MNQVIIEAHEVEAGSVTLTGRRARHLITVLGIDVGRRVRVGMLDGGRGSGIAEAVTPDSVRWPPGVWGGRWRTSSGVSTD